MNDADCVRFLRATLPSLGLRWRGFRNVRGQVCKRLGRRLDELGLPDLDAYAERLRADPGERRVLDALCRITISRFYRDRVVFDHLRTQLLPEVATRAARDRRPARIWSAGCGAGEEPYSVVLSWPGAPALARHEPTEPPLVVLGTDTHEGQLARARRGLYPAGALKDLPDDLRDLGLEPAGDGEWQARPWLREAVQLSRADLRRVSERPHGPFDLILCRNLAFTYFDEDTRAEVARALHERLEPGGWLVTGNHETPPPPFVARRACVFGAP